MDKFEEIIEKTTKMSPDEQEQGNEKNRGFCICGKCPSHDSCMKGKNELLYCFNGKSACTVTKKGCLCPTCPMTSLNGLKHFYFCAKGSEREQRGL